jgi:hypothetical protein
MSKGLDLLVKRNYRDPKIRSRRWCRRTRRCRRRRRYSQRWLEMGGVRSNIHNIYKEHQREEVAVGAVR